MKKKLKLDFKWDKTIYNYINNEGTFFHKLQSATFGFKLLSVLSVHISMYDRRVWLTHKGRFRSVNQGLNDEGTCCEVHALTNTYISCYRLTVNEICQCYHFQKQKIAKNCKFIENGCIIYQSIRNFMKNNFLLRFLPPNSFSFPSNREFRK